ncbi:type III secretion protein V [Kluyvera sp. 1366]
MNKLNEKKSFGTILNLKQKYEMLGSIFIFLIIFMLIIPLPLALIDILISISIGISSLLIMLAMFLPRAISFSSFPSVLLITTIFRLALSIATTRQILTQGDAGEIVGAFGEFVIGGNIVVGLVIFFILTIVNFLVITKGAERVAEVAARFTLDALPGKQMSIDSDLRAGLLTASQARDLRSELSKESQLYGAMDGAIKFVKGDSIAGIVILFVNLFGGISIGILYNELSFGNAIDIYSKQTVGDGLISQIPALLISISAGLIITKVSENGQDTIKGLGDDIVNQLFLRPNPIMLTSLAMLIFAIIPGLPGVTFVSISISLFIVGIVKIYSPFKKEGDNINEITLMEINPANNGKEDLKSFHLVVPYIIMFHESMKDKEITNNVIEDLRKIRNSLVYNSGLTLPAFTIEYSEEVETDEFCFYINEVPEIKATYSDKLVAIDKRHIADLNKEDMFPGKESRKEDDIIWCDKKSGQLPEVECKQISAKELYSKRIEDVLYKTSSAFIGLQETKAFISWLEIEKPEISNELQRMLPIVLITTILQNLASERVSLRSFKMISDALIEHGLYEQDPLLLTNLVRLKIRKQICQQYIENNVINAWLLSSEDEEYLKSALRISSSNAYLSLSADKILSIKNTIKDIASNETSLKLVFIVSQEIRLPFRRVIENDFNEIAVLSFPELTNDIKINIVESITFDFKE